MPSKKEILEQIRKRMEEDEGFSEDLSDAVESNDWDWVESLIQSVLEVAFRFAAGFIEGLVRSIFR